MKENFNVKEKKGSISIFVLVGLLFMTAFLMLSYAVNVNKSKIAKEQFDTISNLYSHKDGNVNAYERAYTALREKNKQTLTKTVENSSVIELDKTYEENLVNYRIYGKGVYKEIYNLPKEYQQVEYIESTGTQYIDTGYIPNINTIVKCEYERTTNSQKQYAAVFGTQNVSTGRPGFILFTDSSSATISARTNSATIYSEISNEIDKRYNVELQFNKLTVNNSTATCEEDWQDIAYSLHIFNRNSNNTSVTNDSFSCIKLYNFELYEGASLIMKLIPCYKKIDNVKGMYDLINNLFYENNGTGDLIVGADMVSEQEKAVGEPIVDISDSNYGKYKISIKISNSNSESVIEDIILSDPLYKGEYIDFKTKKVVRSDGTEDKAILPEILINEDYTKIEVLTDITPSKIEVEYVGYTLEYNARVPREYKEVEYIESTGTQYIDTGYIANNNTNIIYDFEYLSGESNRYIPILGQRIVNGQKLFALWIQSSTGNIAINFDTTDTSGIENSNGFGRHVYKNVGGKFYLDDTFITEIYYSEFQTDYPLSIFGLRTSATDTEIRSLCGRVYSLKIYESDELVRNFIPCYKESDKVVGLYDKVNNKFYTNPGTGEFVAGPEV